MVCPMSGFCDGAVMFHCPFLDTVAKGRPQLRVGDFVLASVTSGCGFMAEERQTK